MSPLKRTDLLTVFLLAAFIIVLIEATFFRDDFVFSFFFGIAMIYFGKKWKESWFGKLLFWFGIFVSGVMILSMSSLRMLVVAGLIYTLYRFFQSKKEPTRFSLSLDEGNATSMEPGEAMKHSFLKNKLFSVQSTPEHSYEWKDIHIQGMLGDITVDVSNTVLPKGTVIVSIRQMIGKVKVDIPYEIPVRIRFATLAGNAYLFQRFPVPLWNDTLYFEDEHYSEQEGAETTIVLLISTMIGDVEVNRV
ncbi:cell wall-active antibiotics response protein LiaF [Bacillus sp. B190/17]|uniref:Cell wall-active antibiotics response protein LiaF n=1 Tax=Bacillus lumedeiriae TaxID=3058829 RepID=A0ABW8I9V2_9BACI